MRRRRSMVKRQNPRSEELIQQLRRLRVRGVLMQMAEQGQLVELRCEMPKCYYNLGRREFEERSHPPTNWAPSADHYPVPKALGGQLRPWNVRVAHVLCNRADYGWRQRVMTLLGRGKSLEEIASDLNGRGVPTPHGTYRWTPAGVRKSFES
jgi:hypothetical protein